MWWGLRDILGPFWHQGLHQEGSHQTWWPIWIYVWRLKSMIHLLWGSSWIPRALFWAGSSNCWYLSNEHWFWSPFKLDFESFQSSLHSKQIWSHSSDNTIFIKSSVWPSWGRDGPNKMPRGSQTIQKCAWTFNRCSMRDGAYEQTWSWGGSLR